VHDETTVTQEYSERVASFKRDLARAQQDVVAVIQRHITTGAPIHVDEQTYFLLRKEVSQCLGVHPNDVVAVGSCRMGFSLKRKGQGRARYLPTQPDSDVDIAVVSADLFDRYWDRVYDYFQSHHDWALSAQGRLFARDLFCGWITPKRLPLIPRFDEAIAWRELFDSLTRRRVCGLRTVKGRLYRDWARLEAYQLRMVLECRSELHLPSSSADQDKEDEHIE
jgi:hypothetical protein